MTFVFKIYDVLTLDNFDITDRIKNESFMSVDVDFIQEHLAWLEDDGIVVWSGYVKNILETKNNWEFDVLSEVDYINTFDASIWAGDTTREKLTDVLKSYIVEHDFESDVVGNPPLVFTSPSGNRFEVTNTRAHSGTKSIFSNYGAAGSDEQRAFTRQTSGKVSLDFRFWVPSSGNVNLAMKIYMKDGSNVLAACSIFESGSAFAYLAGISWTNSGKTFNRNAWNKVTIDIELDDETYDLYINRELAHSDDLETLSSGGCDTVLIEHNRGNGATVDYYLDDIFVFDEWSGTTPYDIVRGMDSGADTLLDATIGGLSSLSYTAKTQGDILHDMLMIMAAMHNGNNEFILCLSLDRELRFYTEFDVDILTAADIIDHEWADSEDKELIDKIETTAEINSNLKAASGTITESISGGYLIYQIKHRFRSINRYDLGAFIEYPSGTDRGIVTGIEKEGPIYTYELTDLAYGL